MNLAAFLNASEPATVRCVRCRHRYTTVNTDGVCDVCVFVDDLPEPA